MSHLGKRTSPIETITAKFAPSRRGPQQNKDCETDFASLSGVVVEIGVVVVRVGYWPFAIKLRPMIYAVNGGGSDSLVFQLALLPVGQRPSR